MQYLYCDDGLYNFMDQDSFDQISLNKENLEDVQGTSKKKRSMKCSF